MDFQAIHPNCGTSINAGMRLASYMFNLEKAQMALRPFFKVTVRIRSQIFQFYGTIAFVI